MASAAMLVHKTHLLKQHLTCYAKACADWLVDKQHAVLPVPAPRVPLQGQVCLQGKGAVQVEGAKQARTPRTTLRAQQCSSTKKDNGCCLGPSTSVLLCKKGLLM
jgi:hypothetical protein